jgi:hypothetical protein
MEEAGSVYVSEKFLVLANPCAKSVEQKLRGTIMTTNMLEVARGITMNIF